MESQEDLKIIIKKLINLEESVFRIENTINSNPSPKLKNDIGIHDFGLEKMAKKINIDFEELKKIYDLENGDVKITTSISGKNEPEKQIKASLLTVTCLYYCFGKDTIQANELNKKLSWLGIKSLSILSKSLRESGYFTTVGKSGSHNYSYKIRLPGLEETQKIIKQLISENNIEVKNGTK